MSKRVIHVSGLGKRFHVKGRSPIDLRAGIAENVKRLLSSKGDPFWAVRDVSFEVHEGETLGIVGRNGAGKSTLLKMLSRITYPTAGRFEINGRMSSLLEVGTGFHMELSGRENVYLNGTILGMRRTEVKSKFDEIVAFSGVEEFIDSPVKFYSSGQKVRLAFAVAAHLEPEVLIIDEVLAVGDVEFQRKCLGKMKDVASNGRTVLFVSHNMSAVNSLCERSLLLNKGMVEMMGPTLEVTRRYMSSNHDDPPGQRDLSLLPSKQDQAARILAVRITDKAGAVIRHGLVTESFFVQLTYEVYRSGFRPQPVVLLFNSQGEQVFTSFPGMDTEMDYSPGRYTIQLQIPPDLLNADTYHFTLWLVTWLPYKAHQVAENIMSIEILDDIHSPTHPVSNRKLGGVVRPNLTWLRVEG
jgi:lipopolysaccharide transport system ATP-binding protein